MGGTSDRRDRRPTRRAGTVGATSRSIGFTITGPPSAPVCRRSAAPPGPRPPRSSSSEESTTTAPSATRSGLAARVLSRWSRRRTSSSTRSAGWSIPRASQVRAAPARALLEGGGEEHLQLGVGAHHAADVPAVGHPGALRQQRALRPDHLGPHPGVGRDLGDVGRDLGRADGVGHVAPRDPHPVAVVGRLDADRVGGGEGGQRRRRPRGSRRSRGPAT